MFNLCKKGIPAAALRGTYAQIFLSIFFNLCKKGIPAAALRRTYAQIFISIFQLM